jgi:hypothetical protein|tara:strand:- start:314 stop:562 length:249 start_codon:yes stop_codon:yes gene_type:complete
MTIKHTQKGVKGFQNIPENLQKKSVYNYRMTRAESEAINTFCKENEITKAEMFRSALNTFYKANDIIVKHESNENPNQLRID